MKLTRYRMLDDAGNEVWRGHAYSPEHAEERCFSDETPGSLERFTLQRWGRVKITRSLTSDKWITIYSNQCLAAL